MKLITEGKPKKHTGLIIVAMIILTVVAAKIAWAVYAYNDWSCAFASCRKVTVTEGR